MSTRLRLISQADLPSRCLRYLSTSTSGQWSRARSYTPRRAMMYVPGSDERKLSKIPTLGADCICLDCEDGVALSKKEEARNGIRKILDERLIDFGKAECSVRVNSIESGLCQQDLKAILGAQFLPQTIHLPKVNSPEDLQVFTREYNNAYLQRKQEGKKKKKDDVADDNYVGLIIFIESARALIRLPEICQTAMEMRSLSNLVPEALVFGSDDYVADIGATRTKEATELVYARQKLVTVAKAYELQAIDLVHIDYKDLEGLRIQSEEGARMGFTGKQVIHPGQIAVVQQAFSPSAERVDWAVQLIKEFREHEKTGRGAFTYRGSMIDMPLVKQAQNIVDMKAYL